LHTKVGSACSRTSLLTTVYVVALNNAAVEGMCSYCVKPPIKIHEQNKVANLRLVNRTRFMSQLVPTNGNL